MWFQAAGILLILGFLAGVVWFVTRPTSAEDLYAQAKRLMETDDPDKHDEAYNGPIAAYRSLYASREGDQTAQILAWKKQVEFEESEQTLDKLLHNKFKREPAAGAERDAVRAAKAEEDGDLDEAKRLWQEMVQKYDAASGYEVWGVLADRHLKVVTAIPEQEKILLALLLDPRGSFRMKGVEPVLEGVVKKAYTGLRYEHLGDLYGGGGDVPMALHLFKEMKDNATKDKEGQFWEVFAAWKCKALEARLPAKEDAHARKTLVQAAVDAARALSETAPYDARSIALNVVALYGDDAELKAPVEQARRIVDEMKKKLPG